MLRVLWLLIGLLLCTGIARAQADGGALARLVRPGPADAPLAQVLAELSRQSGVPFSYSSTRIGAGRRCRLRGGPARSLGAVLHELAGSHRISYGLLNGQLVLWPAAEAAPPGIVEMNSLGRHAPAAALPGPAMGRHSTTEPIGANKTKGAPALATNPARPEPPATASISSTPTLPAGLSRASNVRAHGPKVEVEATNDARKSTNSRIARRKGTKGAVAAPAALGSSRQAQAGGTEARTNRRTEAKTVGVPGREVLLAPLQPRAVHAGGAAHDSLPGALPPAPITPAPSRAELQRRTAQVSFVPLLGSNGLASGRTVNDYSLNILGGYSAGVNKVEVAGWLNIVRDTVRGFQAAGIVNVTGTDVRGVQLAGIANLGGGAVRGFQAAGIVNVNRDDARGLQLAGIVNITGGASRARQRPGQPTRLRRWLGLPRLLATDPLGQMPAAPSASQPGVLVQAASIANITGTDVRGVQTASVLNVARRVKGVQFGLVNFGRHVTGAQVGLINFADSVDGASIGIINIVRHGYLHGEVWASESLPLNAVVKLGVRRYYTLLGVASEPFGNRVQWASGFGIGTAGQPRGRVVLSLDLIQWTLAGTSDDPNAESIDTRLLTQLRPALAWQIEPQGRLQLVVSPTLNLAIAWSNDQQPQWDFGANQKLWIDTAGSQSRTRLWPGAQLGLRF